MATNYENIFFSQADIISFEQKLLTMIDAILTFVKYDIKIVPIGVNSRGLSSNENKAYKDWLLNSSSMTIVDLVVSVVPNEEGRRNAKNGIKNIKVDNQNKDVKITAEQDISADDIQTIEDILKHLMFDYYEPKLLENRQFLEQNRVAALQSQQSIFANINQHVRHNKGQGQKR